MTALKITVFVFLLLSAGFSMVSYLPSYSIESPRKQRYIRKFGKQLGVLLHLMFHVALPIGLGIMLLMK